MNEERRGIGYNALYLVLMLAYYLPLQAVASAFWSETDPALRYASIFVMALVAGSLAGVTLYLAGRLRRQR